VTAHGKIDRRVVVIVFEIPLVYRVSLEFKVSDDVILNAFCIVWHVPYLVKGASSVSQVTDVKCGCLIYTSLGHDMRMSQRVVETLAYRNIVEDTKREGEALVEYELRIRWL
jgi:hypothetical protein